MIDIDPNDPEFQRRAARIAEAARRARVEALVACGAPVEMAEVEGLEDAEWDDYLAQAQATAAQKRESEDRARNLSALGDECSPEEASYLTEDQYAHRLLVAQQAQREREERARIEAEEKARREEEEAKRRAELEAEEARAAKATRQEALRPERERIAAWARLVLDTMPSTPAIQDAGLRDRLDATVNGVCESLRTLEKAMA